MSLLNLKPNYQVINESDKPFDFIKDFKSPLVFTAYVFLIMSLVFAFLLQVDTAEILGVSRWLKPFKFAISGVVFNLTIAYILPFFGMKRRGVFDWVLAVSLFIDSGIIAFQSFRMETSHYNFTSPLNAILFAVMGVFVSVISLQIAYLWIASFVKKMPKAKLEQRAIQWGLSLMMLSFVGGGMMIGMSQHTIGAADGGLGVPLLNWSIESGDLRVMHFIGMHAIQILLIVAVLSKKQMFITTTGIALLVITVFTSIQAINGNPFIPFP